MRGSRAFVTLPKLPLLVVPARILELRMVEYVEEFPANLEGHGFPNGKYLLKPQIGVVESRSVKESTIRRAESSAVSSGQNPDS